MVAVTGRDPLCGPHCTSAQVKPSLFFSGDSRIKRTQGPLAAIDQLHALEETTVSFPSSPALLYSLSRY